MRAGHGEAARLALGACLLCALLLLGQGQGCPRCPPDCTCSGSCLVNCSGRGRERAPHPAQIPAEVTVLDLSSNQIQFLEVQLFKNLTFLKELDISNNQISTLEDGIFDNLFNLSEINLSLNPFLCDCKLSWLPGWLEERNVTILQAQLTKCRQPAPLSGLPLFTVSSCIRTCGADSLGCLPGQVIVFSSVSLRNCTEKSCRTLCYGRRQTYGGLDSEGQCWCGHSLELNSSSSCLQTCRESLPAQACGTSIVQVFPVELPACFMGLKDSYSLLEAAALNIRSPYAFSTLQWDFGDEAQVGNSTDETALHKYALPGSYNVTVTLFVEGRITSVQTEISVVSPPDELELQCPSLVRTGESLQVSIRSRGGTNMAATHRITSDWGETVSPMCPLDGLVFPRNGHCYQLILGKADWFEAQQYCRDHGNGALATVSDPELRNFLITHITRNLEVWIGFNDSASSGAESTEEGFDLESCQNWLPGEPHPSQADRCIRMGYTGQCNTDLCTAKHTFVCEYKPQELLLNTDYFLAGNPTFNWSSGLRILSRVAALEKPSSVVQMMLFSGLGLKQDGYLTALEFVTQDLQRQVQMRFQVYAPTCCEGCEPAANPSTLAPSEESWNRTGLECPRSLQWCHFTNTCLPLNTSCGPGECSNGSSPGAQNGYALLTDYLFIVPAGNAAQYLARFQDEKLFLSPYHIFGMQHDALPGMFLQCLPMMSCSHTQSYLTVNHSDWMTDLSDNLIETWTANAPSDPTEAWTANAPSDPPETWTANAPSDPTEAWMANAPSDPTEAWTANAPSDPPETWTANALSDPTEAWMAGAPGDPTEAWTAGAPSDPTEASTAGAPSDPTEAWTANAPRDPSEAWTVGAPGDPTEASTAGAPGDPTEASTAGAPSDPTEAWTTGAPSDPTEASTAGAPSDPTEASTAGAPGNLTEAWTTGAPSDPTEAWTTGAPSDPTEASTAGAPSDPTEASTAGAPSDPTEAWTAGASSDPPKAWMTGVPIDLTWNTNITTCSFRILATTQQVTPVFGQHHNHGLHSPGRYTMKATFENGVFAANLSCSFWVVSPVLGLQVIYPTAQNGVFYVSRNQQFLVLKISSGMNATATWLAGNQTAPFESACPLIANCARETNDTWFSVIRLNNLSEGINAIQIAAENAVSSQNITVLVKTEEPIAGLSAYPDPEARVLLNTRVSYVAKVEAGSDVTFRWTVDDKPSFTYYNVVFIVIYQSAAMYKLSLTASNHVSSMTVSYNVSVEKMNKMRNLTVLGIPANVTQNVPLQLSAYVLVDSAVEAEFWWTFGDGMHEVSHFKPPYNQSFLKPDSGVHQVLLQQNVTHTYQAPGEYTLAICVSNKYENLTQQIPIQVYSYLINVTIEADQDVLVSSRPISFEAYPLPSSYGIIYIWNFGDGSASETRNQSRVTHTYISKGTYCVSLEAFNVISATETEKTFRVFEEITGLSVSSDEPTELNTPTSINASVQTGDNITWIFDLGDGTTLCVSEPNVRHMYLKDANYTVNVTAVNPVNAMSQTLLVQIFVLQILKIEPSSCILEQPNVKLTAYVSGDFTNYVFNWTFGDGSSNVSVYGYPFVIHNFTRSGIFHLSLVLSSNVNKANYFTSLCIEPEIANVTLLPAHQFVQLGEESTFQVIAFPLFLYRYIWDFGTNDTARSSGTEIRYMYKTPGLYLVIVTVYNNVSSNNDTAFIEVQEPVAIAKIELNGTHVLELGANYLFTAVGNGTKVNYEWDFGDGDNQVGQVVIHAYNSTGIFTINLRGWNNVSSSDALLNITVKRRIQGLTINASRTVVPLNGSVNFVATLQAGDDVRYSWILCDRCTPIVGSFTICYTFRSVGTFNVIVTAENEIGSLQDSIFIFVLQPVEGLQIVASDLVDGCCFPTNRTLQLQAAVRDGTNISYSWTVLKNNTLLQNVSGKMLHLSSQESETYIVYLKATNKLGSSTTNRTLEFIESIGHLKPLALPNPAAVNASVNISASITSGTGITYIWYLPDRMSLSTYDSFILHNFQSPGLKEVTITAENTLGFANASIVISVQEPIAGLQINAVEQESDYVSSGTVLLFHGKLKKGTNVSWLWKLPNSSMTGQMAAVPFPVAGQFSVSLNASNDISWQITCKNITVQDKIQGLELLVSKKIVEPGERVSFMISMTSGSSVTYLLSIVGNYSVVLNSSNYTHEFSKIGDYLVTVIVQNQVSIDQTSVVISVLEAIHGLRLVKCCDPGMPTGIERNFLAEVSNGSLVAYTWQFDLRGHSVTSLAGPSVFYTPEAPGLLIIHVSASNGLGAQNITHIIQVQDQILLVSLNSVSAFVNRTVFFEASVLPSPLEVVFSWTFGDGNPVQITAATTIANHSYSMPGDYLVEVNATNLVSFFIAQATVTVRILECEEPEVQLVLPPQVIMKRSQRNYIEAEINLRGCIRYKTEYLWEIYRASSCLHIYKSDKVHLPNVDVSRPQLVVPKLVLDIGDYCFVFVVSFGDTPLSKKSFANVTMLPSKLVPIIDGGSFRVWSNSRDLIMDGEKSYDPNLDDSDQTPLLYKWSCISSTQSSAAGCPLNITSERGVTAVSRAVLEADVEYTFDLTISKPGRNSESTNQTVLIKKGQVPIVSLKCVSCKAQSVYEVSKSSYVFLEGSCRNCQEDLRHGRWTAQSFKNKSLILDMSTTSTGNRGMNLVLRQGVLRDGEGYTFTLHVTDPSMEKEGYASIDLLPNSPPAGGSCRLFPNKTATALTTKVHFECIGWRDQEDDGGLVFSLVATRCKLGHCEEFCVYKGSRWEYTAFLPPGFQENQFLVDISVVVQDHQGASVVALNSSLVILLPSPPEGLLSLAHWLYNQTESALQGLVKQGDPQHVTEFSLALIVVLNEYEQLLHSETEPHGERELRIWTRKNITETLISLKVNTVDDIQQVAAALAQCMVASKELICDTYQRKTLSKLEDMMSILQNETTQGTMTPTAIADNILNIMGDLIHLVSMDPHASTGGLLCSQWHSLSVASKAYNLSSDLMRILMKSRVLNEEPLTLEGNEITARGKRSDLLNLLCYSSRADCQFSIPQTFNNTFSDLTDIIQVMFRVDSNPFPFGYISNYTVSTEVASMEFQTGNGTQIVVEDLDPGQAITVTVKNSSTVQNISAATAVVQAWSSIITAISTESKNRDAGLHFQITYRLLNERYASSEPEPFIVVYLHHSANANEYNYTATRRIGSEALQGSDHKLYTFFIPPLAGDAPGDYFFNISNRYMWSSVEVSVGVYTSLCQYFSESEMRWKTEGLVPLEDTTLEEAVCRTQHLTSFGASLFVPPHVVHFIFPPPPPGINYIVVLTCVVCFVTYSVVVIIVHKLDLIDVNRAGVIPFCGKNGAFKYEVLVKTGWGRGSGTTAHVGISLYGIDDKSGHRHLDGESPFHRNSLDVFQIATEKSLGSLWKIRIWHDNKGLSPSWYLQHVIIRDLQSSRAYYFLVNDWLSVDGEDDEHMVEKEVFAASEMELRRFSRIFRAEMQRGFSENHVWLSLWDRPPRSRFTRVQRATCCSLLIFLFFGANTIWYGIVGSRSHGNVAVSQLIPVTVDTMAVGMVSSVIIYPFYLILLFLFRMTRSKTSISQSLTCFDQQSVEIDNCLDSSIIESSFITFSGAHGEAFSDQTKTDFSLEDSKSLIKWHSNEGVLSWPDLLSDASIMGNTIQRLKRGRASRHLGMEASMPATEDDGLSLIFNPASNRYFTASDEDMIRQILVDGAGGLPPPQDWAHLSHAGTDQLSGLSSIFREKIDSIMMQRLNEKRQSLMAFPIKSTKTAFSDDDRKCLFPSWCIYLSYALSCLICITCIGLSVWIGVGFTSSVGVMWLISGIFSFLSSFFIWEPMKVFLEALYFSLVAKRLHPEEDDTLVECPVVEPVSEKINKVRPPQGFALFQARDEARKVKLLHHMLKNFLVYMFFFLVILLTNYGDTSRHRSAFLLQSSLRQELDNEQFLRIRRLDEFWAWMSQVLLPYLYRTHSIQKGYSTTLGAVRLRQVRLVEVKCQNSHQDSQGTSDATSAEGRCTEESLMVDTRGYASGWTELSGNVSDAWTHSPPDLGGVWYWGFMSLYDSGGYVQLLGSSLEESKAILNYLQENHWIDNMSRAIFVELTQYNPGVDLHAVVTLLLELPLAGRALPSVTVWPFPLLKLSGGVHLLLLMMVFLMVFVVYFVVSESLAMKKEGAAYFTVLWNYIQWLTIVLTICTVVVHLSRASLADQQWDKYLNNRQGFTNFYQIAFLTTIFSGLSACLLCLLTVKAAQQLRFIRPWSIFGKTLQRSAKELLSTWVIFLVLALAYAQLGFLLFSSSSALFHSFGSSFIALFDVVRGSVSLGLYLPESSAPYRLYCLSYLVLEAWMILRLFTTVLIRNYGLSRLEMYRPAFEAQDYEMVELFLRRLRMWIGVSKVKEFRYNVRFEGMAPLPSRSSSNSRSFRSSTPSAASDTSSSSSQLDSPSTVNSRERSEVDANIQRLLPVFESLLLWFDRVNQVTEDVYRMECHLAGTQTRITKKKYFRTTEDLSASNSQDTQRLPNEIGDSCSGGVNPRPPKDAVQPPRLLPDTLASIVYRTTRAGPGVGDASALLPMQKTYSVMAPGRKKQKSLRAKNKIHPSDR
ncbi:polycystin-1 isoform X2 [Rhinatrema bivittatum]|uniref:polycystin-1 isoform X2 n=1 Tax=Rhinatrema bivittatum TaxID=194408 RepID=UPI00112D974E|nr:polycystin-1 isoform X2 [Rhinatrema bivittatum]